LNHYFITDECINCGACKYECPNDAVAEPGEKIKDDFFSDEHYFIIQNNCTRCEEQEEIKCIIVCPMNAIKEISN